MKEAVDYFKAANADYEIWNEPDTEQGWWPSPDLNQYGELAKEAIAKAHEADPTAKVSVGSLSYVNFLYANDLLLSGTIAGADAFSVHPYRDEPPETAADSVQLLSSLIVHYCPEAPPLVWSTEWGYSATNLEGIGDINAGRDRQAILVARELLSCWAMGLERIVLYSVQDESQPESYDPNDPYQNYGLIAAFLNDDGTVQPKPALVAVTTLTRAVAERTYVGALATQPTSLHAMKFVGATDVLVALWSDAPGGKATVTLPATATAIDHLGAQLALQPLHGKLALTVGETTGPIYVTIPVCGSATLGCSAGGDDTSLLGALFVAVLLTMARRRSSRHRA